LSTLLGPEETDLDRGHCRLVVALMPPWVGGVCLASCGTGLLSDQLDAGLRVG
jgi:hypothetical protein